MKCPQCGQSNFNWAKRCDRCKGPLTATPAPSSPGRALQRGPQDAGDEWPDAQASLAPVVGRTFAFNGVSYTAQERSRRLRDSDVYPLRHNASQLVTFELKVFRCDPGSERYAEVRQGPPRAFRTKATLARPDDPGAESLVLPEIYEQDGRLLGLQRAYKEHPGPAYHAELMTQADALMKGNQLADAVTAFDRVLALNPDHIAAWGNKGVALARQGDVGSAIKCWERCISIDANDPIPYRNAADFSASTGQFERATLTLARLVQRYPYEFSHWRRLAATAARCDTVNLVEPLLERGLAAIADVPAGVQLTAAVADSRNRWRAYAAALEGALSTQLEKGWAAALPLLDACEPLTKRNAVVELNRAVCRYHTGDAAGCLEHLRACHHRLNKEHGAASQLLALLCSVSRGQWQDASFLVRALQHRDDEPPRIPVAAALGISGPKDLTMVIRSDVIDDLDVAPVVAALDTLARRECSAEERADTGRLIDRYRRLASQRQESGGGGPR